ncbi:35435_t:CDS:2, partial [Gigaspora margarita]
PVVPSLFPNPIPVDSSSIAKPKTEDVLIKLTEAITSMITKVQEFKEPPWHNSNNWNNSSYYTCKCCEQMGYYAHNCPNSLPQTNPTAVATGSNAIPLGQNNRAQNTLLPVTNNGPKARPKGNETQNFLNLYVEEALLFLPNCLMKKKEEILNKNEEVSSRKNVIELKLLKISRTIPSQKNSKP